MARQEANFNLRSPKDVGGPTLSAIPRQRLRWRAVLLLSDSRCKMTGMWYVYILTSERDGKLYVGSTNDLKRRLKEHEQGR